MCFHGTEELGELVISYGIQWLILSQIHNEDWSSIIEVVSKLIDSLRDAALRNVCSWLIPEIHEVSQDSSLTSAMYCFLCVHLLLNFTSMYTKLLTASKL